MTDAYDVIVVGGGMVGLVLAAALAEATFSVALIESKAPHLHWNKTDYDARVSAIHLGTYKFLNDLMVFSEVCTTAYSPLERMEVWDAAGGGRMTFDATDIGQDNLGYIIENRELIRVLWRYCEAHKNIQLLPNTTPCSIGKNNITLNNQKTVTADLIVGADGARSWLRQKMNVNYLEKPYHHNAIVAVIEIEKTHACTAYQPFLSTGPLGVLPLSDPHQMAIVWSAEPKRSEQLLSMSLDAFNRELGNALNGTLGVTRCLSERKSIPLIQRHVEHYVQDNKVLVGDAAHTLHPLAGQGANLGFMDVACLAKTLSDAKNKGQCWYARNTLRCYERWRKSENDLMMLAMRGFQSVFSSDNPVTTSLRSWGFNAADRFDLLKRYFMRCAVHNHFP